MAIESYIFGKGQKYATPQELARARAINEALLAEATNGVPRNVGEGLASLGKALSGRWGMSSLAKREKEGRESAAAAFNPIAAALGGGSAFPPAPKASNAVAEALSGKTAKADNPNLPSRLDFARSDAEPANLSGNKEAFVSALMPAAIEASQRTGVDPRLIVAQAAQETGWGKSAPGNNYFGIKSHGQGGGQTFTTHEVINGKRVKINDSFRQFASPGDSVAGYADFLLKNPRYKPMMQAQGLDAQLQALGASGYATDPNYANSVGAIARSLPMPGGGAAAATQAMATGGQMPQAPVQVASLDPSAGMSQAMPPMPQEYAATGMSQEQWQRMNAPQGAVPPAPQGPLSDIAMQPPQQGMPPQAAPPQMLSSNQPMGGQPMPMMPPAGTQMAQVQPPQGGQGFPPAPPVPAAQQQQPMPEMAGNGPQPQQGGIPLQTLYQTLSNPWLSEDQKAVIYGEIERQQQAADPMRQLQLQKMQRELTSPQKNWQKLDDNTLYEPATGEIKKITPGEEAAMFGGNSVEAQGLNYLVRTNQLSRDQAAQLAAGKTITNPADGSIIFLTPQGVFGQPAGGGAAQPIAPNQPPQAQPSQGGQPAPQQGQQNAPQPLNAPTRDGLLQITPPKPEKETESQRTTKSKVDTAFKTITGELDRYAELVGKTGIEAMPGEAKDNLNTVRQGIMLQMKELFNLGVLNGPDLSLMERMIYDPVIDPLKEGGLANLPSQLFTGAFGGAGDRARNSVSELKRMLGNIKQSTVGTTTAPPPPQGGAGQTSGGLKWSIEP
ncbi:MULTISPECIES: glucosaminidase domain-containing protein [unclassified Mesorhizobium]|uniref:glucosaminidase domain-containing protein n=1 Tax=unclassified Mesorhizobium TaxID=325217 RepID=UPI00301585B1